MGKSDKKIPAYIKKFNSEKVTPQSALDPKPGHITFSFRFFDKEYSEHLYEKCDVDFSRLGDRLKSYEHWPWSDIARDRVNHSIEFQKLDSCHQTQVLQYGDLNNDGEIWSLRMGSENRIWGFKKSNTFYIVWWDPKHEVFDTIHNN